MKVKLTAKFHPGREGEIVELSDKFAEALIADGKAEATTEKAKAKGKKEVEVEEPQAPAPEANEAPEADVTNEGEEIVIE
jgi:ribosomal protein L9